MKYIFKILALCLLTAWTVSAGAATPEAIKSLRVPVLSAIPSMTVEAGSSTTYTVLVEDNPGVIGFSFSVQGAPFVTITPVGKFLAQLTINPTGAHVGSNTATVFVVNNLGQSTNRTFTIVVTPPPTNCDVITATNLGNPSSQLSKPAGSDVIKVNDNYHAFVVNDMGFLVRLDYGTSLLNTPVVTRFMNLGSVIAQSPHGIAVAHDNGEWYGFITCGYDVLRSRIVKLKFGSSLTNDNPTVVNLGNIGGVMNFPMDLSLINDNGIWVGLTPNAGGNNVTRLVFGASLDAVPTAQNFTNIGTLAYPTGLFTIKNQGVWHAFVSSPGDTGITRLDFGASLQSTPAAEKYKGMAHLNGNYEMVVLQNGSTMFGIAANAGSNTATRINFPNGLTGEMTTTALNLPDAQFHFPGSISNPIKENDKLYMLVTNTNGSTLTRLNLTDCSETEYPDCTCSCLKPFFEYLLVNNKLFTREESQTKVGDLVSQARKAGYAVEFSSCALFSKNLNGNFYATNQQPSGTKYTARIGDCEVSINSLSANPVSFAGLRTLSCAGGVVSLGVGSGTTAVAQLKIDTCFTCQEYTSTNCYSAITDVSVNPYAYGMAGNWRAVRSYAYYSDRAQSDANQETNIRTDGAFADFKAFWKQAAGKWEANKQNSQWVWNMEATLFNRRGLELENHDPLGRYNAGLYGYDDALPTAVVSNSRYRESGFDGFEDYFFDIGVCDPACAPGRAFNFADYKTSLDATQQHTGQYSLRVAAGASCNVSATVVPADAPAFNVNVNRVNNQCGPGLVMTSMRVGQDALLPAFSPLAGKKMLVGGWVKESQPCSAGTYTGSQITIQFLKNGANLLTIDAQPSGNIIEGWQRIEKIVTIPADADMMTVMLRSIGSANAYFDDIRIHPYNANMKSFVYDPVNLWLMAEMDENNYATFYEYDEEGSLVRKKKETERGIKTITESRNGLRKTNNP